jgi:hypothetical protein
MVGFVVIAGRAGQSQIIQIIGSAERLWKGVFEVFFKALPPGGIVELRSTTS